MNITKRLKDHYAEVSDLSLRDHSYPYPTSYDDKDGRQINFKYEHRVEEKLVFIVLTDTDERVIAKFTKRYSADVHMFLASLGYAPSLRAVAPLPGGWIMVVMDLSPFSLLSEVKLFDELREQVRLKVTNIVQTLHKNGFVHGDIWSVNVLVEYEALQVTGNEDFGIHLLDFDWAGWIGEAKYPTRVNTETVRRPEGVADGEDITCDHDLGMVDLLC
jgi:Lipopolysaccharide kinase (Kdo/WaaP) family